MIDAEAFKKFATEVLRNVGVPDNHAVDTVAPLVWASLCGVDTHGVRNFKSYYVDTVVDGQIKGRPQFTVEFDTAMSVRADGDNGLGLAAGCWGMRLAIEKAAATGIGLVSVRNSNHLGALGFFSELAVKHDMIGLCMSGHLYADGTDRGMPPVFSLQPKFGTNPLSVAIPCGDEPTYVLDMATAVVPVNRVIKAKEDGQPIPLGWCLDAKGIPTTDPAAAKIYLPLGSTRELGAHKGFGLAMFVEVLTALLSGGWSDESGGDFAQDKIAHFFGAIRIDLFREPGEFKVAMDAMLQSLRRAPAAPGQDRVYMPGEIEHDFAQQRRKSGIPLTVQELRELNELSSTYGVPLELMV
jgi:LDH2 family malate/lactate/ureidoglycolate dehydrogenase